MIITESENTAILMLRDKADELGITYSYLSASTTPVNDPSIINDDNIVITSVYSVNDVLAELSRKVERKQDNLIVEDRQAWLQANL